MVLSRFESLPDEILMIIFQYFSDIYILFRQFFGLNQRLNSILLDKRLHLFTNYLQINIDEKNFHYYYNSNLFQTISQKLLLINTTKNENQLYQSFQSLIHFHIQEQYIQIKSEIELKIENIKSIRQNLSNEELIHIDKNLKKSFENLRQSRKKSSIKQIETLVYNQGACLEYNDHEQSGFYFSEDFSDLFFSSFSLEIIQIFQTLFLSNLSLLKYPCYGNGYKFSIYEFLLYYYYHNNWNIIDKKIHLTFINLILFTIQCQKYLSNKENSIEKIIRIILNVFSKRKFLQENNIFIQITQLEILKILFNEYLLLPSIEEYDEDLNDQFRYILNNFIRINRLDVILLIYRSYKPIRDFFNNQNNLRKNINMMTANQIGRELFFKLLDEKPLENWLINKDLIFILLDKKERKILEKLLKISLILLHQLDQYENNLLLYICLRVSGCRHRIVEFLLKMGCDREKRNLQGINFNDALLLPKNRRLLENLIKRKSIEILRHLF